MKRIILILSIIIFLFSSGCATRKKAREYNNLRGLMLLDNTQLGRNKHFGTTKYQRVLKKNHKKFMKKSRK